MTDEEKEEWMRAAGGVDPAWPKEPNLIIVDDIGLEIEPLRFAELYAMRIVRTDPAHALDLMNARMAIAGLEDAGAKKIKEKRSILSELQLAVDEAQAAAKWKPLPPRCQWDRGSAGRGRQKEGIAGMIHRLQMKPNEAAGFEEAT